MKINFEYEEYNGHRLTTTSDDGTEIEILFNGFDADYYYINGNEFEVKNDDYKGLYVMFGGEVMPIANVIQQANAQIEDIVAETEQEQADEEGLERELSSLKMTGRI